MPFDKKYWKKLRWSSCLDSSGTPPHTPSRCRPISANIVWMRFHFVFVCEQIQLWTIFPFCFEILSSVGRPRAVVSSIFGLAAWQKIRTSAGESIRCHYYYFSCIIFSSFWVDSTRVGEITESYFLVTRTCNFFPHTGRPQGMWCMTFGITSCSKHFFCSSLHCQPFGSVYSVPERPINSKNNG